MLRRSSLPLLAAIPALALGGCAASDAERSAAAAAAVRCAPDNGGITLPQEFCAAVVADGIGAARHLTVRADGDVFVALRNRRGEAGGIVALRDTTGDGSADLQTRFGENGGTGIQMVEDTLLYFATDDAVLRYRVPAGALEPAGAPDTIVGGLPSGRSHSAKSIAVGGGALYVNHGSPSNSCQVEDRQARSPGQDPCPELETRAGVWRFDAERTGQTFEDGERYSTGSRNLVALALGPNGTLYGVQHGRDQLGASWGYDEEANAEKPAEEMFAIQRGDDFGWPYCYHDLQLGRKVLAPEYGGDGREVGRCAEKEDPVVAFPGHWGPNAITFYTAEQFPAPYRGGAFVAFHGSWNRAPLPQGGYNVVFVPFEGGAATGEWEVFADSFAGTEDLRDPGQAAHRPSGVAVGPDGSLYVSDDAGGRIWRIVQRGPSGGGS